MTARRKKKPMEADKVLAKNMVRLREERGWSQDDLAKAGYVEPNPNTELEYVKVRREDLVWAVSCKDFGDEKWDNIRPRAEAMDRLKAALTLSPPHEPDQHG